jgi:predicted transcriptional regulator
MSTRTQSAVDISTESEKAAEDKVRFSLDLSPSLNKKLDELAAREGTTKAELLRRAIALIEVVAEAKQQHRKLGIFDANRKLLTEIIGL